ncbi:glycosyl transferase [Enterococcus hermanniensis]|uniref:Glycosyl transferase n=1 Tax=Enterococcus hermanniensis TaxID=249189 RepID=A0A1L8TL49_9ENTE|nr:glycosyl transferase [Enterococcus hermanniensis]
MFNAATTIARTINVLKELDNNNFEVLLVNDGSTDDTREVLEQCISLDSRFQVLDKKNQGPGIARNYGIEHAKGEYLLFFDADDYPQKTILQDYEKIILANSALDLIISSFTFRTLDKEQVADEKNYLVNDYVYETNQEFLADMYELMNQQLMYVVWNKCYRRDIILKYAIRFKNYRSCEDRIFNLDYYKYCSKIVMNPKIEYIYEFEGGAGITNQYNENKFKTFKEFYERSNSITNDEHKEGMAALLLKGTTSVIFSILATNKLNRQQKAAAVNSILKDSTIIEAKKIAKTDTTAKKITKLLFNMPNPVVRTVLTTGSFVENKMPGIMAILKRKY